MVLNRVLEFVRRSLEDFDVRQMFSDDSVDYQRDFEPFRPLFLEYERRMNEMYPQYRTD